MLAVGSSGGNSGLYLSEDGAASWRQVLKTPLAKTHDYRVQLGFDRRTSRVYFNGWSWSLSAFTLDPSAKDVPVTEVLPGSRHVCGVAVDPADPSVVYAACYADGEYTMENVWRSTDGGATWEGLCRSPGDGRTGPDGANQARGVTVNPKTREPVVTTHCCGVWRYTHLQ